MGSQEIRPMLLFYLQWSLQAEENADKSVIPEGTVEDVDLREAAEDPKPNETTEVENSPVAENDASPEEAVTEQSDETPAAEETTEATEPESLEEEASEETPVVKLETAPADFRFPTTNQTRHCFTRYIEYHRCINAKGEGAPECDKFAKYYRSLCPSEWVERWNEQRENGTFPGPL
ncbi:unnamed protein product [Spirodela intermedia]|uniref:Uncharacterized protein n=1 Tax=Spirodela intermedia TaxID=51605 RepID=A0A7I8KBI3_SPIIN|nr:unnamed protein product [Spirodela intermedia]